MLTVRRLSLPALAAVAAFAVGCSSIDRHAIVSPIERPLTVSVVSADDETVFWSMDIPAGQKVVVNFQRDNGGTFMNSHAIPADRMTWRLYNDNSPGVISGYSVSSATQSGTVDLPGTPVLLDIDVTADRPARAAAPATPAQPAEQAPPAAVEEAPAPAAPAPVEEPAPAAEPAAPAAPAEPAPAEAPAAEQVQEDMEQAVEPAPAPAPAEPEQPLIK